MYKTLVAATKPEIRYKRASKAFRGRPVIQRLNDEVIGEFTSIGEAFKHTRVSVSSISNAIRNKIKSGGFNWEFA
jgi:hypothetical protein